MVVDLVSFVCVAALSYGLHRRLSARQLTRTKTQLQEQCKRATGLEARLATEIAVVGTLRRLTLAAKANTTLTEVSESVLAIVATLLEGAELELHLHATPTTALSLYATNGAGERAAAVSQLLAPVVHEAAQLGGNVHEPEDATPHRHAVNLVAEDRSFGVLAASFRGTPRTHLRGQVARILDGLALHVAAALHRQALYERTICDPLTKLYNRRHFDDQLERLCAQANRTRMPLTLLMIDLDHFKRVNDTHGHQAGDAALAKVGETILTSIRTYDIGFRYGGEELTILAPDCHEDEALALAERIRSRIAAATEISGSQGGSVTASIGIASWSPTRSTARSVVAAADRALYRAKRKGRNCVSLPPPEGPGQRVHSPDHNRRKAEHRPLQG